MKARKVSKKKKASTKAGYVTEGRRQSTNVYDRRPGSINIGPNYNNWSDGSRRCESGVNARMEMGTGRSSSGSGSSGSGGNRQPSGRGKSC